MRIYLTGDVARHEELARAARNLRGQGFHVASTIPTPMCQLVEPEYMETCDAIVLMPLWSFAPQAVAHLAIAERLGLRAWVYAEQPGYSVTLRSRRRRNRSA